MNHYYGWISRIIAFVSSQLSSASLELQCDGFKAGQERIAGNFCIFQRRYCMQLLKCTSLPVQRSRGWGFLRKSSFASLLVDFIAADGAAIKQPTNQYCSHLIIQCHGFWNSLLFSFASCGDRFIIVPVELPVHFCPQIRNGKCFDCCL